MQQRGQISNLLCRIKKEEIHTTQFYFHREQKSGWLPQAGDGLGGGPGNLAGLMEMFRVMKEVWLTLVYPLVTADQTTCFSWVRFTALNYLDHDDNDDDKAIHGGLWESVT